MRSLLVAQKLHKALDGKDKKPATMEDNEWDEMDGEACAAIILCLERDVAFEIKDEITATGMWDSLESKYLTKTLSNKSYLKTKMYKHKMQEGGNLRNHIREFERIISDLKDVDVKVDDDDQALLLMLLFPKSYESLTQTMLLMENLHNFEEAKKALLQDELRKLTTDSMGSGEAKEQAQGLYVRGRNNDQGYSKKGYKPPADSHCYKCNELGHWKRDCPNKKIQKKNANNKEENQKDEASLATEDSHDECWFVSSKGDVTSSGWILDTGCFYHMCSNRKWFTTYTRRLMEELL